MGRTGILPEISGITGLYELSCEYSETEYLRTAVGISDSDHPGTSSESDPESRDQEKNSASDLCAEFYFRYRTLWYGSYVSFTGRSAE